MTAAEEVRGFRHELRLDRTAFARALGLGPRGYAQVRKWEEGVGEPSAAALTAMRLLVELEEAKRLPWMGELWGMAQTALEELQAIAERTNTRSEYRTFCSAIQILRPLLKQRPR